MASFIKLTDTKGKFVGGAAARRKKGTKIQNPMVREKLKTFVGHHIHPQERMLAAILRSMPRDILKSHNFPFYREQLRTDMCDRVRLPPLAPLKSKYTNMREHNQMYASMVLEEARHIIAESLFKRWGKDRTPPETGGIEMEFLSNEKMRGSAHFVYFFQAKRDLTPDMKSKLRPGTVVELMPIGHHSMENMVLGNVVRYNQKGVADLDEVEVSRQISIMIYNKSGENFEDGVRLVPLDSLLNLTRQFDACTNGNNDLNGEILGFRQKRSVHTFFTGTEYSEDENDHEVIEIDDDDDDDNEESTDASSEDDTTDDDESDDTDDVAEGVAPNDAPEVIAVESDDHPGGKMMNDELECSVNRALIDSHLPEGVENDVNEESSRPVNDGVDDPDPPQTLDRAVQLQRDASKFLSLCNNEDARANDQSPCEGISTSIKLKQQPVIAKERDDKPLVEFGYYVPNLNPTQKKAADAFLNSTYERISIVQGPPGTGKTTLLVSVICQYLLRAKQSKKVNRLLVSAPTNKAVTVLAVRVLDALRDDKSTSTVLIGDQERLLADNYNLLRRVFVYTWRNAMVEDWERIAKDLQVPRSIGKDALIAWAQKRLNNIQRQVSTLIDDHAKSTMVQIATNLKALLESPESATLKTLLAEQISLLIKILKSWDEREVVQVLLAEANVIFCTLSSAGSQVMKETVGIDDIIVDEAAAATAPELCVGLWLVNNRLLLVGDPHQLPATVNSDYGKQNGLDKSLQDRLMNQCGFQYTMLDVQYRMKAEISYFPVRAFYNGKVTNGENVVALSYQAEAAAMNGEPYAFVQVEGVEHRDSLGSCYNPAECDVVMGLLQDLKHRSRHVGNDWASVDRIRVITFYQAQVNEMRKRLVRLGLHNVLVSTVDSSQGCEADVIIISFVRSEVIGFLSDYRRLNVALTRAKHQLVCVGNVKSLATLTSEKAKVVSQLAKDAIERRCVVENYRSARSSLQSSGGHLNNNKHQNNRRDTNPPARSGIVGSRVHPRDKERRTQPSIPPTLSVHRAPHNRQPDDNWKKRTFSRGSGGAQNQNKKLRPSNKKQAKA